MNTFIDWDAHNNRRATLLDELVQSKIDNNRDRQREIESEIEALDDIAWQSKTSVFSELKNFTSLFDALSQTAKKHNVDFPNILNPKKYRFIISLSNDSRSILVSPNYERGIYIVDLGLKKDGQVQNYGGRTKSIEDVVSVLSRWYVKGESINLIHKDFPWISREAIVRDL
ncbi:MAG: hypothetical protein KF758_05470 [Anaerolineales bacterium]|nr:hypothetical protein [Anaerolineales bacterium]MBX3036345.1 hypothetical protein [Anaerolineales bacterium]